MAFLKPITLLYFALRRIWGAILVFISVFLIAFIYGAENEPPYAYLDRIHVKQQFERSLKLRDVNLIVTGDSSGFSGVDPALLEKQFKAMRVQSLSSAGLVGPLGHMLLVENYLKSNHHLDILLIIWTPLALSLPNLPWESSIIQETGGQIRAIPRLGRAVLRDKLFWGYLNPPFPGKWAQMYGDREIYKNFVDEQHGTVIFPVRKTSLNNPVPWKPYDYKLSRPVESSLRRARAKLRQLSIGKIFLAFTPMPYGRYDPDPENYRKQFMLNIQNLIGLPKESILDIPPSLPDEFYSDPYHLNGKGRLAFTQLLNNSLLNSLCELDVEVSEKCAKSP